MRHPRRAFLVAVAVGCVLIVVTVASVLRMITPAQIVAAAQFIGDLALIAVVGQVGVRVLGLVFDWSKRPPSEPHDRPHPHRPRREAFTITTEPTATRRRSV